jgi:hypothetical protein
LPKLRINKVKQDQRKAELQAAALRDGFETWSQALTAWKNGEARLTKVAADGGKAAAQKVNPRSKVAVKPRRR